MKYEWEVSSQEEGTRLDQFIQKKIQEESSEDFPIRFFKSLLDKKHGFVNGKLEKFGSYRVQAEDKIVFYLTKEKPQECEVLFNDEAVLAVNKPAGVLSDPKALSYPKTFLVHRLDKETSGVILLAKTQMAKKNLMKQFKEREIEKSYLALVQGKVKEKKGMISGPFGKKQNLNGNSLWGTVDKGPLAETYFRVLELQKNASLLEVCPKTGKTHQIRAHLSEIGHPIVGDYQYGSKKMSNDFFSRHLLHALKLRFFHPITKKPILLTAKAPLDFLEAAKKFKLVKRNLPNDSSPSVFWRKLKGQRRAKGPVKQKGKRRFPY